MDDETQTKVGAEEGMEPLFRRGAWSRLALALLPLVTASGVVLAFVYRPDAQQAWGSVAAVRGGDLGVVRDLHRWGGELLVIAAWLHLLRVFMVGAYRRMPGWSVSVAATLLVVVAAASGWALRHDAAAARFLAAAGIEVQVVFALHALLVPLALALLAIPARRLRRPPPEDAG